MVAVQVAAVAVVYALVVLVDVVVDNSSVVLVAKVVVFKSFSLLLCVLFRFQ